MVWSPAPEQGAGSFNSIPLLTAVLYCFNGVLTLTSHHPQVKSYGVLFAEMMRLYPDSIQVALHSTPLQLTPIENDAKNVALVDSKIVRIKINEQ